MSYRITPADQAETLWVVDDHIRFLGGVEGHPLQLIEVTVPPGSGTPPHVHASPELFLILDGEVTVRLFPTDAAPVVCRAGAGTTVRIDGMEPHAYVNETDRPARMLAMLDASMIAFFRDIGRPERRPEGQAPDLAAIGAAMARHGIDMAQMAA